EAAAIRRAAIDAITHTPNHDAQTFSSLASLLHNRTDCATAAAAIRRIPREQWPRPQAIHLARSLITYAMSLPPDQRATPASSPAKDKPPHHTTLVQPLQSEHLQFPAPQTPGDYPFSCSFPLHYKTMTGTLHVVPRGTLDAPKEPAASQK